MKKKLVCLLFPAVMSGCASLTPEDRALVDDVIFFGAALVVQEYPEHQDEINIIADVIRANGKLEDSQITALVNSQLESVVDDVELRVLLSRIITRVINRTAGIIQEQKLAELANTLTHSFK